MSEHNHPDRSTSSGSSFVMSRRGLLTAGTAVASAVAVGAVPTTAAAAPNANGVIYGIEADGDLLWYRHEGRGDGTPRWANGGSGLKVGNGWQFDHVFQGGDGVIYAIEDDGDLLWYRHEGESDGTVRWAHGGSGRKVGNGWRFDHVFSGGGGVIYAVAPDTKDLLWYRHEGRSDGTARWANRGRGRKVGNGWNFEHVFGGGGGIIYAIEADGDLLWYRHEGRSDGTPRWANRGRGRKVGNGWNFEHVFYGN